MLPPWPWLPGCCSCLGLRRGCASRPASTLHACKRGHCLQALCSACSCLQGGKPVKSHHPRRVAQLQCWDNGLGCASTWPALAIALTG